MCRIAMEATATLADFGIEVEIIDVQTLSPFDLKHSIRESVRRTGAVVLADEDVPVGGSAFMMREVVEVQGAYEFLDSPPKTISSPENRPAYGGDGDYFCKPSRDDLVRGVYEMVHERRPALFPSLRGGMRSR